MTLPASGLISLSQVNTELTLTSTALITLNDAAVRTLFAKPSGLISMSDGHGKSAVAPSFNYNPTISSQQNFNLRAGAVAAGWNQTSPLICTVTMTGGGTFGSSSTGAYAFDTGTSFPVGSTLALVVGSGAYLVGCGGSAGGAGGPALRAQYPITVTNNGVIGGGGGSGGQGYIAVGGIGIGDWRNVASGGGAGSVPGAGYSGTAGGSSTGGSTTAGGAGAIDATNNPDGGLKLTAYGGAGGSLGAAGAAGNNIYYGNNQAIAGGAGGAAVVGNGNITWAVVGTRYGSIS